MKKLIVIALLLLASIIPCFADTKISDLPVLTTAQNNDLLYVVDENASPVASKQITVGNLQTSLTALSPTLGTGVLNINGVTGALSTWVVGSLTTGMGLAVTGGTNAVLGSGAAVSIASGYYLPTTTDESNWNSTFKIGRAHV